jgi:hypothetical protein
MKIPDKLREAVLDYLHQEIRRNVSNPEGIQVAVSLMVNVQTGKLSPETIDKLVEMAKEDWNLRPLLEDILHKPYTQADHKAWVASGSPF